MKTSQKRMATPLGPVSSDDGSIWNYRWNTGEVCTVEVPEELTFDPRSKIPSLRSASLDMP